MDLILCAWFVVYGVWISFKQRTIFSQSCLCSLLFLQEARYQGTPTGSFLWKCTAACQGIIGEFVERLARVICDCSRHVWLYRTQWNTIWNWWRSMEKCVGEKWYNWLWLWTMITIIPLYHCLLTHCSYYLGNRPVYLIADSELLKEVLVKQFDHFTDRFPVGTCEPCSQHFFLKLLPLWWLFS